jgi:hypothetical protein
LLLLSALIFVVCFLLLRLLFQKGMGWDGIGESPCPGPPITALVLLFCFFHGSEKTIPNYAIHYCLLFARVCRGNNLCSDGGGGGAKGGKLAEAAEKNRRKVVASYFECSE